MGDPVNQFENPDNPTVLLRRLHHWRMAFFGLVILLAGMLSGAAVTLLVVGPMRHAQRLPSPIPPVDRLMSEIVPRLNLSQEQAKQVGPILQRHYQRLDVIRQEGRTAIMEELKLMNSEMFAVLNEGQAHLWQQLLQELPGEIRHVPGGFGPGGGGGGAGGGGGPGFRRRAGPPAGTREPVPHVPAGPVPPEVNTVPHQ